MGQVLQNTTPQQREHSMTEQRQWWRHPKMTSLEEAVAVAVAVAVAGAGAGAEAGPS